MQNPLASTADVTALQAVIATLRQENEYLRWQLAKNFALRDVSMPRF